MAKIDFKHCAVCPNECMADRNNYAGICKSGVLPKLARAGLHFGEEPCISGKNGSGTIFFSGCSLGCIFCQNKVISHDNYGKEVSIVRLSEIFKELEARGAHNINLVNPTHYSYQIIEALDVYKPKIPVIYNCGGYEKTKTLQDLDGYIDIYLPDIKYAEKSLSERFSNAKEYPVTAFNAVKEMAKQTKDNVFDDNGMLIKGLIIRHLVLPLHIQNTKLVLNQIKEVFGNKIYISILFQYTPVNKIAEYDELNRVLTKREKTKVEKIVDELGFVNGYIQEGNSADKAYIPDFDLTGV